MMKSCCETRCLFTKGFVAVVLMLCMMSALLLPAFAELDDPVELDNCDTAWNGTAIDRNEKTEGTASITKTIGKGSNFVIDKKWNTPIDASGANHLEFDLYVSNADAYYSMVGGDSLEVTSSGRCDVEEIAWNLTSLDVAEGWNHIVIPLGTGGACDLSRVNYVRLYANGHNYDGEFTIKLDNFYFTYIDPKDTGNSDTSGMIVGTETSDTALPPVSQNDQTGDQNDQDVTPAGDTSWMTVLSIVMFCVAGAALLALLVLAALKKASRWMLIILCVVTAIALLVGAVLVVGYDTFADSDGGEGDDEQPSGDTNDDLASFLEDQTGHPEVSADDVDVEALLKVDPNYDSKEDYKIFFEGVPPLNDYSQKSHVVMTETPQENGMSFSALTPEEITKTNIKDKDCWIFTHYGRSDTNKFRLSLDDAQAAAYDGKTLRLNFVTYVSTDVTITVEYKDKAGNTQSALFSGNHARGCWTEIYVDLVDPAFDGSYDGYDFFVTVKGPEMIRIHAVYATENEISASQPQTGLIQTEYDTSYNIIAEDNVLLHGARGDGYTDDTAAFQKAIDAVAKKGGGTIFVPAGYYCLTKPLSLPTAVALVGELEMGTANGTVLCIYHGKGTTNVESSAVFLNSQASVQNMAFWYPEQTIVNGMAIPYPPTITQTGSEGVTVRNVTFVNAYYGLNYATLYGASNSLQYTRDIYGTCLDIGYYNTPSYDIGKLENFNFAPDYWLDSGLPGTPNEALLRTYMLRHSTGIILERIDWTYIADITVKGYRIGMQSSMDPNGLGTPNGHMYNINLLDCYWCFYAEELSWMMMTDCDFRAVGNDGAAALYIGPICQGDISMVQGNLQSAGANAIINHGASKITLTSCTVKSEGTAYANLSGAKAAFTNTVFVGGDDRDYGVVTSDQVLTLPDVDYGKTVEIKPNSDAYINLTEAPYNAKKDTDITAALQQAIDDLKESGGTVYLPAGTYIVSDHIDVWSGVELRGVAIWSHSFNPTCIYTAFGRNDPDGEALFDLYEGAGMIGISVVYYQQDTNNLQPYSFTIRGRGADIYLMDVTLPTSWNGVDFASYRCDNHYIEYIHGAFMNVGITVGAGSENGIIRDCHFTPNCFAVHTDDNWWSGPYASIMTRGTPYVIGESKNQILYHNFTYGAAKGLVVSDGAENVYVLSHGVDSGDISAYFSGNCTVTLVDTELVNLNLEGHPLSYANYVYTAEDFKGRIDFVNVAGWGTTRNAFCLNGNGKVNVTGGLMITAGSPLVKLNSGRISMIGLINSGRTTDFSADYMARSIYVAGNLFASKLRFDHSITEWEVELSGADLAVYGKK